MDAIELDLTTNRIIIKISMITGWTIPASEEMFDMLVDQLSKKMIESYPNLNEEEVEYAFRNKGLNIKDWGKSLNLVMIDEVLMPYLDNRFDLSMQEEKIKDQPPVSQETKTMTDEEWEEWLLDISKYSINKIPCDSYSYLERTGKIKLTTEEKHNYMKRSIAHLSGILDPLSREGIEFSKMKVAGIYSAEVTGSLITYSKRLAVYDYFNKQNQ